MTEPRDYQHEVIAQWHDTVATGKRKVIIVAPTGAGKTHIAVAIIKEAVAAGQRMLVLAHTREIVGQTTEKLFAHDIDHGLIQSGQQTELGKQVQVASIQTFWSWAMRSRRISLPPADLLVVDECHHAPARTWRKIIASYPNVPLVGLTATPCRSDGCGLGGIFDAIVECPQVAELIAQRCLVRTRTYAPVDPDLKGDKQGSATTLRPSSPSAWTAPISSATLSATGTATAKVAGRSYSLSTCRIQSISVRSSISPASRPSTSTARR